jgi:hypothetical protein
MSASFSPAELNYDTHDKELLPIIRTFEHWRIFLEGTEHPVTADRSQEPGVLEISQNVQQAPCALASHHGFL